MPDNPVEEMMRGQIQEFINNVSTEISAIQKEFPSFAMSQHLRNISDSMKGIVEALCIMYSSEQPEQPK